MDGFIHYVETWVRVKGLSTQVQFKIQSEPYISPRLYASKGLPISMPKGLANRLSFGSPLAIEFGDLVFFPLPFAMTGTATGTLATRNCLFWRDSTRLGNRYLRPPEGGGKWGDPRAREDDS